MNSGADAVPYAWKRLITGKQSSRLMKILLLQKTRWAVKEKYRCRLRSPKTISCFAMIPCHPLGQLFVRVPLTSLASRGAALMAKGLNCSAAGTSFVPHAGPAGSTLVVAIRATAPFVVKMWERTRKHIVGHHCGHLRHRLVVHQK